MFLLEIFQYFYIKIKIVQFLSTFVQITKNGSGIVQIELGNMDLPVQERKTPQSKVIITASSPWARLIGSEALICDHDGLRLTLGDDMYSDGNVSFIGR